MSRAVDPFLLLPNFCRTDIMARSQETKNLTRQYVNFFQAFTNYDSLFFCYNHELGSG